MVCLFSVKPHTYDEASERWPCRPGSCRGGLPQDPPLSPILFTLYLATMVKKDLSIDLRKARSRIP
ncbi:hypothetical protein B0H67DRAFT_566655 [Lasiosphaeris hirsuta]|uniref:Reverse transcriptase n=1 Tax=Lasiosphaeris hirsuta TaxID=260670 RepID=A0AA40BDB8_9PEZI|nr:hypothetical protein B0H67DRAFT_566655 [Lasiosphaeris hirsuta]